MNEQPTVELSTKLTHEQVALWRQAITKAAPEEDVKKSLKPGLEFCSPCGQALCPRND
jgi:peptide methionine sulfoxide reductase MsrB